MPLRLILRRLLQAVPLLLGVVVLNFALIQSVPGTFLDVMTAEQQVTDPALIERLRVTYGLDQPPTVQLLKYIGSVASLDFGYSYRHNLPVLDHRHRRAGRHGGGHRVRHQGQHLVG
ncbi:hypothetical protein G6F50_017537 [Rhizopus delemar]|uniref:ABC transporter type 1 GsiC-like N-terminal domain-containing protein n=1 Tax=Rhizopus delemar TaxID=936053 RepID=A0A9P6XQC3_9FUNG|nr:hypothetical protein G6F50_017537 [Rhizopus delemar]